MACSKTSGAGWPHSSPGEENQKYGWNCQIDLIFILFQLYSSVLAEFHKTWEWKSFFIVLKHMKNSRDKRQYSLVFSQFLKNNCLSIHLVNCSSGTEQKLSQFTSEEIIILYQLFKCLVFCIKLHHIIPERKKLKV